MLAGGLRLIATLWVLAASAGGCSRVGFVGQPTQDASRDAGVGDTQAEGSAPELSIDGPRPDLAADAGVASCSLLAKPTNDELVHAWISPSNQLHVATTTTIYQRLPSGSWAAHVSPFSAGAILNLHGDDTRLVAVSDQGQLLTSSLSQGNHKLWALPQTMLVSARAVVLDGRVFIASTTAVIRATFTTAVDLGSFEQLSPPLAPGEEIRALWQDGAALLVAGGDGLRGFVGRWDPSAGSPGDWQPIERNLGREWLAGWGALGSQVVVGANTAGHRSAAAALWVYRSFPELFLRPALWGRATDDVYLFGDSGEIYRFDGVAWVAQQELGGYVPQLTHDVVQATGHNDRLVLLVDDLGESLLYDCALP